MTAKEIGLRKSHRAMAKQELLKERLHTIKQKSYGKFR